MRPIVSKNAARLARGSEPPEGPLGRERVVEPERESVVLTAGTRGDVEEDAREEVVCLGHLDHRDGVGL